VCLAFNDAVPTAGSFEDARFVECDVIR
jgi:hypothetical protein